MIHKIKPMRIQYSSDVLYARPLTGAEVMHIAEIGKNATETDAIELLAYITSCCLCSEDGAPEFQGEKDVQRVKDLPFSLIRAVSEHVMAECGLEDEIDEAPTRAEIKTITTAAKAAAAAS